MRFLDGNPPYPPSSATLRRDRVIGIIELDSDLRLYDMEGLEDLFAESLRCDCAGSAGDNGALIALGPGG